MSTHTQQDVCCLMGDPVAGNPTQYMLEQAFSAAELDWRFLTFEVSAEDFEAALQGARIFDFHGIMLAPPHRGAVHRLLESTSDAARLSGQVNCLELRDKGFRGHNTEGPALRRLIERSVALKGLTATIAGAGRLAKSIAAELALAGAGRLELVSPEPAEAQSLVEALGGHPATASVACRVVPWPEKGDSIAIAEDVRLVVNATPVGVQAPDARLPIDVDRLPAEAVVADVTYNPPMTRLIREAGKRGLKTVDGLTLLVEEAAVAFEIWTGRQPDRNAMREAVEEFLVL